MQTHELHEHRILTQLESGRPLTQRGLSRELGIALGLTNLLIGRLVKKGFVRLRRVTRSRIRYLLTRAGVAEKLRLSRAYFETQVQFYREASDHVRQVLSTISRDLAGAGGARPGAPGKRVAFCGAGELAEIAYICVQRTDLTLVALIDDQPATAFFHVPVIALAELRSDRAKDWPFDRLVITSLDDPAVMRSKLAAAGVPLTRVVWL
jgi:DNA-binding MarR family transcriptional regulator